MPRQVVHGEITEAILYTSVNITAGLFTIIVVVQTLAAPALATETSCKEVVSPRIKATARTVNDLSLRVMQRLISETREARNIVISPIGLAHCLNAVSSGAAGKTRDELRNVLSNSQSFTEEDYIGLQKFIFNPIAGVDISSATAIFALNPLKFQPAFETKFKGLYDGALFSAPNSPQLNTKLNEWIKTKTQNKIQVSSQTVVPNELRLLNALYFKALWIDQFETSLTKVEKFNLTKTISIPVEMMHKHLEMQMFYGEPDGAQIIRMPYGPPHSSPLSPFAMYIVLPKAGQSPEHLISTLTAQKVEDHIASMRPRVGDLSLPRFSLGGKNSFKTALNQIGVKQAFSPVSADFSFMTSKKPVWLGDINQNIRLLVNERGTEAAVITEAIYFLGANPEKRFNMVVDRPFLFFLRDDRSGAMLLCGIVHNPQSDKVATQEAENELLLKLRTDEARIVTLPTPEKKDASYTLARELSRTRDYFTAKQDFSQALEISRRLLAIEKPDCTTLYRHAAIELALSDTSAADLTFKKLIDLYAVTSGYDKTMSIWLEAFDAYDAMLLKQDASNPARSIVLAAKESFLKQQAVEAASTKERFIGAWRRDLSTIAVPDASSQVSFQQYLDRYDRDFEVFSKDIVPMRNAMKDSKAALRWKPSLFQSDYFRLGEAQSSLARFYYDQGRTSEAIDLFELSIINNIEDDHVETMEDDLVKLEQCFERSGKKVEALALAKRLSTARPLLRDYLELHKKWVEFKEDERRREYETRYTNSH